MSTIKKKLAIYSNLPSGGAKFTYQSTTKYLKKYFTVSEISEPIYKINNIIQYLYVVLCTSQKNQERIIKNTSHDLLLAYHSWMVKSPSILRYTSKNKVYICHEPLREYYDNDHIKLHSLKEKFINIIRLPVKWLDRINIGVNNVTIIVNSHFSKKLIDKAYNINSTVVYPGVDTRKYVLKKHSACKVENQVICISSINKYKRQYFLLKVVGNIPQEIRPTLVLIGNGADSQYLHKLKLAANQLRVKVKIIFNISETKKIEQLHKSKVFIYAPISEPFGLVVEEAIAAGLPLLVYGKGGGYTEIIEKNNGYIMDNLNANHWASNLESLLSNPSTRKKISSYNVKYAAKYLDIKRMNSNIISIIRSVL